MEEDGAAAPAQPRAAPPTRWLRFATWTICGAGVGCFVGGFHFESYRGMAGTAAGGALAAAIAERTWDAYLAWVFKRAEQLTALLQTAQNDSEMQTGLVPSAQPEGPIYAPLTFHDLSGNAVENMRVAVRSSDLLNHAGKTLAYRPHPAAASVNLGGLIELHQTIRFLERLLADEAFYEGTTLAREPLIERRLLPIYARGRPLQTPQEADILEDLIAAARLRALFGTTDPNEIRSASLLTQFESKLRVAGHDARRQLGLPDLKAGMEESEASFMKTGEPSRAYVITSGAVGILAVLAHAYKIQPTLKFRVIGRDEAQTASLRNWMHQHGLDPDWVVARRGSREPERTVALRARRELTDSAHTTVVLVRTSREDHILIRNGQIIPELILAPERFVDQLNASLLDGYGLAVSTLQRERLLREMGETDHALGGYL